MFQTSFRKYFIFLFIFLIGLGISIWYFFGVYYQVDWEFYSYTQKDQGARVLLDIKGKNLGSPFGNIKLYINEREINQRQILKWNKKEIQIFISKPFTSSLVQLKQGNQKSPYIPVWNNKILPNVQSSRQVQNFPVLENYRIISERPTILEIHGQNLGFRYQNHLLLFSRYPHNHNSIYFDFSSLKLKDYRILKISEIRHWSNQVIRVELPQETSEGPIFLLRINQDSIQSSNSLYVSTTPNPNDSQVPKNTNSERVFRLQLQHKPGILVQPELWAPHTQTHNNINKINKKITNSQYQEILDTLLNNHVSLLKSSKKKTKSPPLTPLESKQEPAQLLSLRLHWPRNELNQFWHMLSNNKQSNKQPGLIFPVQNFHLLPLPEELIQEQELGTPNSSPSSSLKWLLQTLPINPWTEHGLYVDFSYITWQPEPPVGIRNLPYNPQELQLLDYQLLYNREVAIKYQVPQWAFDSKQNNPSPYAKALHIYQQVIPQIKIHEDYLPNARKPFLQWHYNPARPTTQTEISQWPHTSQQKTNEKKALIPEQVLLLLLRAMTEENIPSRIVAGAVSNTPKVIQNQANAEHLYPYFWIEIYLPNFGWFPIDPIEEILNYQQQQPIIFWGRLENKNDAPDKAKLKLAFFVLQDTWQRFDNSLYISNPIQTAGQQPNRKSIALFYWDIYRLR